MVEPDGRVTCVGTGGRTEDEIWVSAVKDRDSGHISFDLLEKGPGPTLDFLVPEISRPAAIPDDYVRFAPCCRA